MKRALLLAFVLALAPAANAAPQEADESALAKSLTGEARALYELGRSLYASNDVAGALTRFQRAFDLSQDPRLLWNMAACEAGLKHWARAMTLLDRYVTGTGSLLTDRDREKAAKFRSAAHDLVATVHLSTEPDGALVTVDGEPAGTTPFSGPLYLDQGARRVHFTKTGYRGVVRVETVRGGSELTWKLPLERLRVKPL